MESNIPKVLHNLENKALIDYVLDTAYELNPEKIFTVVGFKKELVINHINNPNIEYIEQKEQLGTGHAVLQLDNPLHGILNASPRPRYGVYAPICSKNGVAFFGRDSESTLPVWSAKDGYPGDKVYREFHKIGRASCRERV